MYIYFFVYLLFIHLKRTCMFVCVHFTISNVMVTRTNVHTKISFALCHFLSFFNKKKMRLRLGMHAGVEFISYITYYGNGRSELEYCGREWEKIIYLFLQAPDRILWERD